MQRVRASLPLARCVLLRRPTCPDCTLSLPGLPSTRWEIRRGKRPDPRSSWVSFLCPPPCQSTSCSSGAQELALWVGGWSPRQQLSVRSERVVSAPDPLPIWIWVAQGELGVGCGWRSRRESRLSRSALTWRAGKENPAQLEKNRKNLALNS